MVQVMRWCEHGETVRSGRSDHGCSGCVNGVCGAALACQVPEPELPKRRPSLTRRARNRLLMAAIAGAGVLVCGVAEVFHRFS